MSIASCCRPSLRAWLKVSRNWLAFTPSTGTRRFLVARKSRSAWVIVLVPSAAAASGGGGAAAGGSGLDSRGCGGGGAGAGAGPTSGVVGCEFAGAGRVAANGILRAGGA